VLPPSASVLEENIDRVVDSVIRNISAGRGAVPDIDAAAQEPAAEDEDEARETLADLCGHVAYALKSLDAGQHALATYKAPEQPAAAPMLNLIR
jgi:hypothetical protein